MEITWKNGIFAAYGTRDENLALKAAGFKFHGPPDSCPLGPARCLGCRHRIVRLWYTKRAESAARLLPYADRAAKLALAKHLDNVQRSRATDSDVTIAAPPGITYFGYQKAGILYLSDRYAREQSTILADEQGLGKTLQVIGLVNHVKTIRSVLIVCPAALKVNWYRESTRFLCRDERVWNFEIVQEDRPLCPETNFAIVNYQRVVIARSPCPACEGERRRPFECPRCAGSGDEPGKANQLCTNCNGQKTVFCARCNGRGKLPGRNLQVVNSIMARKWDIIAYDEAHAVKNPKAARSRAVFGNPSSQTNGIVDQARSNVFLTGTPIPNRPVEIYPLLHQCAPEVFGSYRKFVTRYCDAHEEERPVKAANTTVPSDISQAAPKSSSAAPDGFSPRTPNGAPEAQKTRTVLNVSGASNLAELQELMRGTCMLRRLKADVLKDLPPKIRQIINLEPTEEAKILIAEEIDEYERRFGRDAAAAEQTIIAVEDFGEKRSDYDEAVTKLQYIQSVAFTEMSSIRRRVAVAKIPSILDHLERCFKEGAKKIICFAHHIEVIERIMEAFGKEAVSLYGETRNKQRSVDLFQKDERIRLFVGGLIPAGEGITLHASSHVVFGEIDWSPRVMNQCEDRAHRIGQKKSVLVQQLVLDGSLDARMAQVLVIKQRISKAALDNSTLIDVGPGNPEIPVPPVETGRKLILKEAILEIACNRSPEGGGFSSMDNTIGQKLAHWKGIFSDKQAHLADKLVARYRRQVSPELQKKLGIWRNISPAEERRLIRDRRIADMRRYDGVQSDSALNLLLSA